MNNTAQDYMEMFKWAYTESSGDLSRLQEFQNMYDNKVDDSYWPTISKIPIPALFTMVERSLPNAMQYLFPEDNFVELLPTNDAVDLADVEKLEGLIRNVMA